jgi:hypothetical protein
VSTTARKPFFKYHGLVRDGFKITFARKADQAAGNELLAIGQEEQRAARAFVLFGDQLEQKLRDKNCLPADQIREIEVVAPGPRPKGLKRAPPARLEYATT